MKSVKLIPPASPFFESMRDIGYTLDTALADIVDNSLTAQATSIDIFARGLPEYTIGIVDNGHGMTYCELLEAMTYASRDPREVRSKDDLGRFGLGLKLASLSQCKKLTVVTKKDGILSSAIWDQSHIDETRDWDLLIPDDPDSVTYADRIGESGTLVLWEDIDTLDNDGGDTSAQQEFTNRLNEARTHLELIFHRFISGEPGLKKCSISLNYSPLESYEPFHRDHPATQASPVQRINANVTFQVFTLPHHSKVTKSEWAQYGGKDGYLKNQGLYIYRERRLIIHGTWLRITRQTELNKLTRVKVDITNAVDSEWGITLDKSSARLPAAVREQLRNLVETISGTSRRVYTHRGQRLTSESVAPAWSRVQNKNQISYEVNSSNPVIDSFLKSLNEDSIGDFSRILDFIGSSFPVDALYADMGGDSADISPSITDKDLEDWALTQFDFLLEMSSNDEGKAVVMLKMIEPYKSHWDRTENILISKRALHV